MRVTGLFFLLSLLCASTAQADSTTLNRSYFEEARSALNRSDLHQFETLKAQIADYPLTPYLDIWLARKNLKQGSDKGVRNIVETYADIPESINLRIAWLRFLAKRGAWKQISQLLEAFPHDRKRVPEIAMVASWYHGDRNLALEQFSERWIQARKISGYSSKLHQQWQQAGHPTHDEIWLRMNHFANKGKWRKVKTEQPRLGKSERPLVNYWQNLQKQPEKMLANWPKHVAQLPATLMLSDGLIRLSRENVETAWSVSLQLADQKLIPEQAMAEIQQQIALRAARQHHDHAATWLSSLPIQNEETRSWTTRIHIIQQQWQQVIATIDAMPDAERQQSNWLYWKAFALEQSGNAELAHPLYLLLAEERGYYSFLAAEKIGLPLKLKNSLIDVSDREITTLTERPAIRRAYEWLQLGNANKASREWHFLLQHSDQATWRAATRLAYKWNWFDQTIRSAFKADALDALDARFPLGFEDEVLAASKESGLSPASIWSIIRQESAFNHQAVSYVGARGLMQLMPRTARSVAKKLKMRTRRPDLFSPKINIRLGSTYLAEMNRRFGNLALAAAAYNAGPHRVSSWLSRTPFDAGEAWVEAIPFNETRRYVQQVMAFVTVYEWRQQKTPSSLTARIGGGIEKVSLNRVQ